MKTVSSIRVPVSPEVLAKCAVKAEKVEGLDLDQTQALLNWCEHQSGSLWIGMNLQELLNVYRVSATWPTWQHWADVEGDVARRAWNRVVLEHNHLTVKG